MYLAGASVGYQDMMLFAVRKIEAWSTAVLAGRAQDRDNAGDGTTGNNNVGIDIKADIGIDNLGPLQRAVQRQHDGTMDYALLRLANPLRRALRIVYEQPPEVRQGLLLSLRLALVRFVDVALPYLATDESFRAHFRNEWMQPLTVATTRGNGITQDCVQNQTTEKTEKTLAENVLMDHALFQELGMLRRPDKRQTATATAPASATVTARGKAKPAELPSIAYLFDLLRRLARIDQWDRHANITSSKAANDGDGRRNRGSRGDRRDWRMRVGEAQREHDVIMRELEHALRGVFDKVDQG